MSNTYELIQQVRDELGPENSDKVPLSSETTHTGQITYTTLLRFLNRAQRQIQLELLNKNDTLFMTYSTANTVANQVSYTMPADCLSKRVRYLERYVGSAWIPYTPAELSDRDKYEVSTLANYYGHNTGRFYLLDNDIFPLPLITVAGTDNLRVHYTKRLCALDFGAVAASANTTVTLASTASITADYYNGYNVTIVGSGTAAGQSRAITDYSVLRVATVATWTNNPATTDYYAIECELGEDFEVLLVLLTQLWCLSKMGMRDQAKDKKAQYDEARFLIGNTLADGRMGGPQYVQYTSDT